MNGTQRPWHAGVLYHQDTRFAHALLQALRDEGDLVVGDNEPYSVSSTSDYAVPVHGEGRGLVHVELEIRQDLIADVAGSRRGRSGWRGSSAHCSRSCWRSVERA
jgi:predicted N-formylglutamate amidohydrolase